MQFFFLNIFCSRNKIRHCFEARWLLTVERDIFIFDENASSEQICALLDDVEISDDNDVENLKNDSDTEFIAKE